MTRFSLATLVEALLLLGIGLYLFYTPGSRTLGEVFLCVSAILVIHRVFLYFDISSEIGKGQDIVKNIVDKINAPVSKMSEIIDLSYRSNVKSINDLLTEYLSLREEKLNREKQRVVDNAVQALRNLTATMRTPVLEEPDFYSWLYREFESAQPGTAIRMVSMDEELEWQDNHQEREYFKRNVAAAMRGVIVERIFLFDDTRLINAKNNEFIYEHREGNSSGLIGRRVDPNAFKKAAPTAFRDAGQGFIVVDNHFVIVDVFSEDGQARGYVTFNEADIRKYIETFERFKNLSGPLVFDHDITITKEQFGISKVGA